MRILVAFDKFRQSFAAQEANDLATKVIQAKIPNATILSFPISDGGEGFVSFMSRIKNIPYSQIMVKNYVGKKRLVKYLIDAKGTLYISYASVCGLALDGSLDFDLKERTSAALADFLAKVIDETKASTLVIGIGGSGTQDFGEGFYYRALAKELPDIPVKVICDVETNLENIFIYGPQKGMDIKDILEWEKRRAHALHALAGKDISHEPFYGASGGILLGLKAFFSKVEVAHGGRVLKDEIEKFGGFDYLVTGEGQLDHTSKQGKGPYFLARNLSNIQKTLFFCGKDALYEKEENIQVIEIADHNQDLDWNLLYGLKNLELKMQEVFDNLT